MSRSILVLALVAMMVVGTLAANTQAPTHYKSYKSHKKNSSKYCASTITGCKTCRTVYGELTCVKCADRNAIFDPVDYACECNALRGYGKWTQSDWTDYVAARAPTRLPARPPTSCVKCTDYSRTGAVVVLGADGKCALQSAPITTSTGRRLFAQDELW